MEDGLLRRSLRLSRRTSLAQAPLPPDGYGRHETHGVLGPRSEQGEIPSHHCRLTLFAATSACAHRFAFPASSGWARLHCASTAQYVISVRRDLPPFDRTIGRCVTDNISDWQAEAPGGCPVVFSVDKNDPQPIDVYTNAWTPYPSINEPIVHLYFPSMYHHFGASAPFGLGNDGILDIRLLVSGDGSHIDYTDTWNARSPFVGLGDCTCGASANKPGVRGGWCSPDSNSLATTSFDSSAMYMASGYVPSIDGSEIYFYASGQPFTHGGDGQGARHPISNTRYRGSHAKRLCSPLGPQARRGRTTPASSSFACDATGLRLWRRPTRSSTRRRSLPSR